MTDQESLPTTSGEPDPIHPVLCRVRRGDLVESWHRGSWVVVNSRGEVQAAYGDADQMVWARSTIKSLQAVPLLASGAAEQFGVSDAELALAMASHSGEPVHVALVTQWLQRLGFDVDSLRCGAHSPFAGLDAGQSPTPAHNNCSGKHAGFLTLARHLGADPATYLDPDGPVQQLVRRSVLELTAAPSGSWSMACDGCSAPTYAVPLRCLATGLAQIACDGGAGRPPEAARLIGAANRYPELIGGSHGRLCTELLQRTGGGVFPKVGAEGVYTVASPRVGLSLAVTCDDGAARGYEVLLVALLERLGFVTASEAGGLRAAGFGHPIVQNWAGLAVAEVEIPAAALPT